MAQRMFDPGLAESEVTARVPLGRLDIASERAETTRYLCSATRAFMSRTRARGCG